MGTRQDHPLQSSTGRHRGAAVGMCAHSTCFPVVFVLSMQSDAWGIRRRAAPAPNCWFLTVIVAAAAEIVRNTFMALRLQNGISRSQGPRL